MYFPNSINITSMVSFSSKEKDENEFFNKIDLLGRSLNNIKKNQITFILFEDGSVVKQIKY